MQDELRKFKAGIFQALGHPTRIAIIECLRAGELNAGSLISQVGIEQANASQHLSVLRTKHIVSSRREGNQILYSVRDPRIIEVLDIMRRYFHSHLKQQMSALQEIREQSSR